MATSYEARLLELIDRLQETLEELRRHVSEGRPPLAVRQEEIRAFADEAFRDRDA